MVHAAEPSSRSVSLGFAGMLACEENHTGSQLVELAFFVDLLSLLNTKIGILSRRCVNFWFRRMATLAEAGFRLATS